MTPPAEGERARVCSACTVSKPLDNFYRDRRKSSGRRSQCKACQYAVAEKRTKTPEGLATRRIAARSQIDRKREREQERWRRKQRDPQARQRHYERQRGSVEVKARRQLRQAIIAGRVVKPERCQKCAAPGRIHGHHHDYTKPLEVEWLCPRCHGIAHRKEIVA